MPVTIRNTRQPVARCPELVPLPERAATDCLHLFLTLPGTDSGFNKIARPKSRAVTGFLR
eukprot:5454610-Pleurochrysis_carterae.AAC.2